MGWVKEPSLSWARSIPGHFLSLETETSMLYPLICGAPIFFFICVCMDAGACACKYSWRPVCHCQLLFLRFCRPRFFKDRICHWSKNLSSRLAWLATQPRDQRVSASPVLGLQTHAAVPGFCCCCCFLKWIKASCSQGKILIDRAVSSVMSLYQACPVQPRPLCSFPSHRGFYAHINIFRDPVSPKVERVPESNFPHL